MTAGGERPLSEMEFEDIMEAIDIDGDGSVDYAEFGKLTGRAAAAEVASMFKLNLTCLVYKHVFFQWHGSWVQLQKAAPSPTKTCGLYFWQMLMLQEWQRQHIRLLTGS